jgi:hypothetical protein
MLRGKQCLLYACTVRPACANCRARGGESAVAPWRGTRKKRLACVGKGCVSCKQFNAREPPPTRPLLAYSSSQHAIASGEWRAHARLHISMLFSRPCCPTPHTWLWRSQPAVGPFSPPPLCKISPSGQSEGAVQHSRFGKCAVGRPHAATPPCCWQCAHSWLCTTNPCCKQLPLSTRKPPAPSQCHLRIALPVC